MKEIIDKILANPVGAVIMQILVGILSVIGLGGILPSAQELAKRTEKLTNKKSSGKNKFVGYGVLLIAILYIAGAKLGWVSDKEIQPTIEVLQNLKPIAPDSLPIDTVVMDSLTVK